MSNTVHPFSRAIHTSPTSSNAPSAQPDRTLATMGHREVSTELEDVIPQDAKPFLKLFARAVQKELAERDQRLIRLEEEALQTNQRIEKNDGEIQLVKQDHSYLEQQLDSLDTSQNLIQRRMNLLEEAADDQYQSCQRMSEAVADSKSDFTVLTEDVQQAETSVENRRSETTALGEEESERENAQSDLSSQTRILQTQMQNLTRDVAASRTACVILEFMRRIKEEVNDKNSNTCYRAATAGAAGGAGLVIAKKAHHHHSQAKAFSSEASSFSSEAGGLSSAAAGHLASAENHAREATQGFKVAYDYCDSTQKRLNNDSGFKNWFLGERSSPGNTINELNSYKDRIAEGGDQIGLLIEKLDIDAVKLNSKSTKEYFVGEHGKTEELLKGIDHVKDTLKTSLVNKKTSEEFEKMAVQNSSQAALESAQAAQASAGAFRERMKAGFNGGLAVVNVGIIAYQGYKEYQERQRKIELPIKAEAEAKKHMTEHPNATADDLLKHVRPILFGGSKEEV